MGILTRFSSSALFCFSIALAAVTAAATAAIAANKSSILQTFLSIPELANSQIARCKKYSNI
jgi:hypothetical protein